MHNSIQRDFDLKGVPYRWGALGALPNVSEDDFRRFKLAKFLERDAVLLAEDLSFASPIARDGGKPLVALLRKRTKLKAPLSSEHYDRLLAALEPTLRLPPEPSASRDRFEHRVLWSSEEQAKALRQSPEASLLIRGGPGSGKTIVLVRRACDLVRSQGTRRVLLVCYSIALSAHLRRLVLEQGVGVGWEPGTVAVCHLYELLGHALGRPIDLECVDGSYYEQVRSEARHALHNGSELAGAFSAAIVDEGQDFDDEMIELVRATSCEGAPLVIGLDPGQVVFPRQQAWTEAADHGAMRLVDLGTNLRSTNTLQRFLASVFGDPAPPAAYEDDPDYPEPVPRMLLASPGEGVVASVVADLRDQIEAGRVAPGEVAVLYHDKEFAGGDFHYVPRALCSEITSSLEAVGIAAHPVSRDRYSKEFVESAAWQVAVVSYHSAKGLDWSTVYVLGADLLDATTDDPAARDALLRVALSRARFELVLVHEREAPTVTRLERALTTLTSGTAS